MTRSLFCWTCGFWFSFFALILATATHADDLVPFGASWSYLAPIGIDEDPNIVDSDFDDTWFMPNYNTNDPIPWEGPEPEPLGYGSIGGFANGFATELDTPESGDRFTAYFRHDFSTTTDTNNFAMEWLFDDGAKVYLDGQEIVSLNCCQNAGDGEVATFDDFTTGGGNENLFVITEVMDGETLPAGDHVLAVEVHQANATSSDLGFSMRFISDYEPPRPDPNAITEGIDTFLAEAGQRGADAGHGDLSEWEWDGEDGGGQNHGLVWFDIPQDRLDSFGNGTATLTLQVTNDGSNGDVHRVTVDWLSGDFAGDDANWNEFPNGPGLFPGDNITEDPTVSTGDITAGQALELDVTEDVLAWAAGEPNFGWGIFPTGTNGAGIASFESGRGPILSLIPEMMGILGDFDNDGELDLDDINQLNAEVAGGGVNTAFDLNGDNVVNVSDIEVWVRDLKNTYSGDANLDGEFNSSDLVSVFRGGKFELEADATWLEGDWTGDLRFGSSDLVAAFREGGFEQGPRPAAAAVPEPSGLLLLLIAVSGLALRRKTLAR